MFKKTRRQFMLLNMLTITFFMVFSFAIIYITTRNDIYKQINTDIKNIEVQYTQNLLNSLTGEKEYFGLNDNSLTNSFYYVTDINGKLQINYQNLNEDNYDETINNINQAIIDNGNTEGKVLYKNKYYMYKYTNNPVLKRIIVLDITDRIFTINNLVVNLILIGGIMLVVIFFISYFFTTKSIKPVEKAFVKQKQFISDASHELKTPLAILKTNLDILSGEQELELENNKWLVNSQKEISVMTNLINRLLVLTRFEEGNEIGVFKKLNLSNLATEVILTMEGVAFEKLIMIDEEIEEEIYIQGNYDEIKSLLVILLDNGIKYCNEQGNIKISLNRENGNGSFIISNTGTVIDKEDCDLIFERFYRTNKERERKSSSFGLGLSIGKAICDKHGFTIKAYPENNMTNFKISFKPLPKEKKLKIEKTNTPLSIEMENLIEEPKKETDI